MDLIDIHSHILPWPEDGTQDLRESLAMAEAAVKDGVNLIVATPRIAAGRFDVSREELLKQVQTLNQCLEFARVKLPVLPGAEYMLTPELAHRYRAGQVLTINDNHRYLLVDLPADELPEYADQALYKLQQQGVTPIIAAPERKPYLVKNPDILKEWALRGVVAQVTAASVTGRMGRAAKKAALLFLENGSAQLIGSDARYGEGRMPVLYAAFQEIERRQGAAQARIFIGHNPFQVIQGAPVQNVTLSPRESLWQRFIKITDI